MGFKRLLKKFGLGGGNLVRGHVMDAIEKKKITGKSFKDCLQESVNETIQEDLPGTSHLYQKGKCDGKLIGTIEQALRDEKKIQELHNKHEEDCNKWEQEKKEYDSLLSDSEKMFN